ncbi:MAG: hypothetical protein ABW133_03400 [Polyangiaceae bacterium]
MSAPSVDRPQASRPSAAPWVGLGVLLVAAVSLWWLFREPEPRQAATPIVQVVTPPEPKVASAPSPAAHQAASDGVAIMAAGSGDHSANEPKHPHPITPTHERNFRQISLVAVMNGAMDVGDVEELRRVNRNYRDEYPENTLLQDGYDLIADCLERRTANTQAAAERYWETAIASNLRRYVRRHCLE